jgi:tRNA threonylcarbamoyl adenosine modification protein (Sua5/YciO/YrdC/YwlC family)
VKENLKKLIGEAVSILRDGGVVAFPTDTVYGIGADFQSEKAVKRVFEIKSRDEGKPLSMLLSDARNLGKFVKRVPRTAEKLIERLWPGPLTLIFGSPRNVPLYMVGPDSTLGVRVTGHETARSLIDSFGSPLAATSANLSGAEALRSGSEVGEQFAASLDLILPGYCGTGPPSAVLNVSEFPPTLERTGAVSPLLIARTMQRKVRLAEGVYFRILLVCTGNACRSPMAEGFLKEMLPEPLRRKVIVSSAGTAPLEGSPPTPNAVEAARELGADISGLVSKRLKPQTVRSADLVLTMERAHRDRVAELLPEAWEKTHLLKGYGEAGIPSFEREIGDPIGMPLDFYRTTAREIRLNLKGVVAELTRWLYA